MQRDLFRSTEEPPVELRRQWMETHDIAMEFLRRRLPWEQHHMPSGQAMPRQECWFALSPSLYTYSGQTYRSRPMTPALFELLGRVNDAVPGLHADAVFCNLYRDGRDSIGWHRDDEPVLGVVDRVVIASLSLGAHRTFAMRNEKTGAISRWLLGAGDLFIMREGSQSEWMHSVPKTVKPVGPRINLTFRTIVRPVGGFDVG